MPSLYYSLSLHLYLYLSSSLSISCSVPIFQEDQSKMRCPLCIVSCARASWAVPGSFNQHTMHFDNFTISKIPSIHCFLRKGKLGCCVPWSFNRHTMHFRDELKKGGSCSSGNGCDMVYMFTCKQQISHSLLKMVLVMLMRIVMPVQYDKDVVLVVYVAFVGNGVKARASVIRVGYSS